MAAAETPAAPAPTVINVDKTKALMRKILVAFVVGFAPVFLGGVTTGYQKIVEALSSGGQVDLNLLTILGLSLVSGAVTALTRAVLAVLPGVNLVESDKLYSLGSAKAPDSVVIGEPVATHLPAPGTTPSSRKTL